MNCYVKDVFAVGMGGGSLMFMSFKQNRRVVYDAVYDNRSSVYDVV